jgi:hypothetical protein
MLPTKDSTITVALAGAPRQPPPWFLALHPTVSSEGVFADEYGSLVLRWPTAEDTVAIGAAAVRFARDRFNVTLSELDMGSFAAIRARCFFAQLVQGSLPVWLMWEAPATVEGELAVIRAYEVAAAAMEEKKSASAPSGAA